MGRGDKGKLGFLFESCSCPRWAVTITEHAGSGEHQELGDRHLCSELGVGWGIERSVKVVWGPRRKLWVPQHLASFASAVFAFF